MQPRLESTLVERVCLSAVRWHWLSSCKPPSVHLLSRILAWTTILLVFRQQRHSREGFLTALAFVLFDLGVCLLVSAQVALVGEGAVTEVALERLLACVSADVTLQQPRARERLPAELALVGQRVRAHVHLERPLRGVHLLAGVAGEAALLTVELLVLGQPGGGGVHFPAGGALVLAGRPRRRRHRRQWRGHRGRRQRR